MAILRTIAADGHITVRTVEDDKQFFVRAALQPSTANTEKRTIDVVLSAEKSNTVRVFNYRTWSFVDQQLGMNPENVRLDRINNGAPFLIDHDGRSGAQIGKLIEGSVRIAGDVGARELIGTVQFDAAANLSEENERHVQGIFSGIRRNTSVGFRAHETTVTEREGLADHHFAADWEPFETSSVTMGKDDGAMFRGASKFSPQQPQQQYRKEAQIMPKTPEQLKAESILDAETKRLADVAFEKRVEAETAKRLVDAVAAKLPDAVGTALAAIDERKQSLRKLGRALQVDADAVDKWIDEKRLDNSGRSVPFEAIRDREFNAAAERSANPGGKPMSGSMRAAAGGHDENAIRGLQMLGYLLCGRAGYKVDDDPVTKAQGIRSALLANKKQGRGFITSEISEDVLKGFDFRGEGRKFMARGSLMSLCIASLESDGIRTEGMGPSMIAELACGVRGLQARGLNTVSSFPLLLAETLNTSIRIGYGEYPLTFRTWANQRSAPDFRQIYNVTMGEAADLVELDEKEEIPTSTMKEARESYGIVEHGRMFGLTHKLIVNDRLAGLTQIPRKFGAAGNRKMREIVYALLTDGSKTLTDGVAYFSDGSAATRSRNDDGTPSAFSITTADLMRVRFANRQALNAANTTPHIMRHIACGTGKETLINQVLGRVVVEARARNTSEQVTEAFTGLTVTGDPLLDQDDAGAGLGLAWYGLDGDAIDFAFLEGEEGVQIAVQEDFNRRGMKIRATLDFGAGLTDWRGVDRNQGA